jgi:hypothetical protein
MAMLYGLADDEEAYQQLSLTAMAASTNANAARVLVGHNEIGAAGPVAAIDNIEDAGTTPVILSLDHRRDVRWAVEFGLVLRRPCRCRSRPRRRWP